jgi:hypothetical protein
LYGQNIRDIVVNFQNNKTITYRLESLQLYFIS